MSGNFYSVIWLGFIVHFIFFIAIFDIYFTSPVIRNVKPVENSIKPPSKRVVVISVDGLRYDSLQDTTTGLKVVPFLSWIMDGRSCWGVSHAHLPTESRPGHVAMLAGFYEDPSAVTRGWKENPVDFDSIFNRSICSFAWGSPDIVNIFFKGLEHNCSFKWTYNERQDFSGSTMDLDNWVLNQVSSFFQTTDNSYKKDGSLFFLHLLGQDTSGHTHKPKTQLYLENLHNVDRIVRIVVNLFGQIFPDNKTAFVLTSDHGMTDWGSHGTGDPSETLTPIIAWGSGIRNSKIDDVVKIDQADITPLLAILLGVSIPVNSVGILPTKFLNLSNLQIAEANFLNAQQICSQFLQKRDEIDQKHILRYKKFSLLNENLIGDFKHNILNDIRQGNHVTANEKNQNLIDICFDGIRYYQNYFQIPLFVVTTISHICWILILILCLNGKRNILLISRIQLVILIIMVTGIGSLTYIEQLPFSYFCHMLTCSFLCIQICPFILQVLIRLKQNLTMVSIFKLLLMLLGIESMVIGFFYRWAVCGSLGFSGVWLLSSLNSSSRVSKSSAIWLLSGMCLALFTVLPVVGKQPYPILPLLSAVITISVATIYFISFYRGSTPYRRVVALSLVLVAGCNSYFVHNSFTATGLSEFNQYLSWILLCLSVLVLTDSSNEIISKCSQSFLALNIPYLLLSISHEAFFLPILCVHLLSWIKLEMCVSHVFSTDYYHQQYTRKSFHDEFLTMDAARRSFSVLTYIFVAFFGVGNLATLNSFDPAWVRCFLTIFSPFTITSLILLKVVIPFFAVILTLHALTLILHLRASNIFLYVLIFLNIMSLNFLFLVKNEGSWLDIGTSLSHYIIQQVTIVFLLVLYYLSQYVLSTNTQSQWKFHLL